MTTEIETTTTTITTLDLTSITNVNNKTKLIVETIMDLTGLPINQYDNVTDFIKVATNNGNPMQVMDFELFGADVTIKANADKVIIEIYS